MHRMSLPTSILGWIIGILGVVHLPHSFGAAPPPRTAHVRSVGNHFGLPRGFIHRGEVYVASEEVLPGQGPKPQTVTIWKAPLLERAGRPAPAQRYEYEGIVFGGHPPFRWRFASGCYWGLKEQARQTTLANRIPIDEFHRIDPQNQKGRREYGNGPPFSSYWGIQPVMDYAAAMLRVDDSGVLDFTAEPAAGIVDFDLLPVASQEAVLFLQHKTLIRVWRGTARRAAKSEVNEWDITWTERKADSFYTSVREPLLAYGDRDNWFFLTPLGKLYFSRKPARGEDRKMEPFYLGEAAPLKAMITDCATGRTWCFTEPLPRLRDRMKPSYFELADGTRARSCVAKPSKDDESLPPPLRALMPYARVLLAEKLIDPTPTPPRKGD